MILRLVYRTFLLTGVAVSLVFLADYAWAAAQTQSAGILDGGGSGVSSLGLGTIMGAAGMGMVGAMGAQYLAGKAGGMAPNTSSVRNAIADSFRNSGGAAALLHPPASAVQGESPPEEERPSQTLWALITKAPLLLIRKGHQARTPEVGEEKAR